MVQGKDTVVAGRPEGVTIEDRVVQSTEQELVLPDIDFGTFIRKVCREAPEDTALTDAATGKSYTYADLEEMSERIAAGFQSLGLQPGDMVAFLSANSVDIVMAFVATAFAGARIVCVKTNFNEREMERVLKGAKPTLIVLDKASTEKARTLRKTVPSLKKFVVIGECDDMVNFQELKETPQKMFVKPPNPSPDDLLTIFQSSGSTGLPKQGLITHHNFVSELVCFGYKNENIMRGDVFLHYLPLMHAGPFWVLFLMLSRHVHTVVLAATDLASLLLPIAKYKVTNLVLYPTHGQHIAEKGLPPSLDMSSMRKIFIAGSSIPPLVMRKLTQVFRGTKVIHGYGLTEVCCAISYTREQCHDFKSSGTPIPYVQVKVVDLETGEKLGPGECGEICCKGPVVFKGYLDMPEATAAVFDDEGFLKTGDTGYYTERGELYVLDRIKDLVKCMDLQVAPAELEDLLQEHPDVGQAAVAGVPHEEYGEAPRAFVVLKEAVRPTTNGDEESKKEQLACYVKERVAVHKQLHGGIEFVDIIPQTETGKPHRRQLREAYLKNASSPLKSQ